MASSEQKTLYVIGGATATGKTALAIKMALEKGTEILSADSRQFYREMTIGTAKPTPEELDKVKHHFIDSLSVTQAYSVGDFEREALAVLTNLFQHSDSAILVGGSGLFLDALCHGLDVFPEICAETREKVAFLEKNGGLPALQARLQDLDPIHFEKIDRQNPARLRRALEVCVESGLPYSAFLNRGQARRAFRIERILLEMPRPELYARINARVDEMIERGLEEEVKRLLPFRHENALRTVGYDEFFEYFDGKTSRSEAIEKIKQHSRNYAKRQATWFRKWGINE
jgi:tRNA dimethylallyltransferase